jgi:hypothetical protein
LGSDRRIRQEDKPRDRRPRRPDLIRLRSRDRGAHLDELFEYLDAPVRRVGATDTFVAYAPQVEDFILPQIEDVEKAVQELMKY